MNRHRLTLSMSSRGSAPGRSCLFASTSSDAPASFSSCRSTLSSAAQSLRRDLLTCPIRHDRLSSITDRDEPAQHQVQNRMCAAMMKASCRWQTAPVSAVDDPDQAVRRLEVVAPVGAQRLLTAHVPYVQAVPAAMLADLTDDTVGNKNSRGQNTSDSKRQQNASDAALVVLHGFDVKAQRGADGGGVFAVHAFHDGGLAGVVQTPARHKSLSTKQRAVSDARERQRIVRAPHQHSARAGLLCEAGADGGGRGRGSKGHTP